MQLVIYSTPQTFGEEGEIIYWSIVVLSRDLDHWCDSCSEGLWCIACFHGTIYYVSYIGEKV